MKMKLTILAIALSCSMIDSYCLAANFSRNQVAAKNEIKEVRDYEKVLNMKQDKIMSKMLLILANENLASIWSKRKTLKKDGESLRDLHPFRFLAKCYSEDRFIAAMCTIVGKAWVWNDFKKGLYNSLTEEYSRNNLKPFVPHFANSINVDHALIIPKIENQDWDGLMKTLNENVPRTGNPNRYDY